MIYVMIGLGKDNEYLGDIGTYHTEDAVNARAEELQELMLANIKGELPLKKRLALIDEYFHLAGRLVEYDVMEINI